MRARIAAEGPPRLGLHVILGPTALGAREPASCSGLDQGPLETVEPIAAAGRRLAIAPSCARRLPGPGGTRSWTTSTGLREKYLTAIDAAADEAALEEVRLAALGKKGEVSQLMRGARRR